MGISLVWVLLADCIIIHTIAASHELLHRKKIYINVIPNLPFADAYQFVITENFHV